MAAVAVLIGFTCGSAHAQGITKDVPARIEMYPIPSLTLSDRQFLSGDDNGKPVTVVGELRVAQGSGRLPVVVLMHGSGGVGANIAPWTRTFNAMGISTFVIDGFTGRGITATSTNQALLGRLNFILDIYHSLDVLAKHPRVDPDRIVLMGFSRGGQAALYASLERFTSAGTIRACSSPPTSRSIRTAPRPISATPMWSRGRSGSFTAARTTTIRSGPARPMWSG